MAAADIELPKNTVRVGFRRSKFLYVDLTKHLLHDGEPEVHVSALGAAINEAVSVVEMLKDQQMVKVIRIKTTRGSPDGVSRNIPVDKIEITVVKADGFDDKYDEQIRLREERKAQRAAEGEEGHYDEDEEEEDDDAPAA